MDDIEMRAAFDGLNGRLDKMDGRLGSVEGRLGTLTQEFRFVSSVVGALGNHIADLHQVVGELAKQIQSVDARLAHFMAEMVRARTDEVARHANLDARLLVLELKGEH